MTDTEKLVLLGDPGIGTTRLLPPAAEPTEAGRIIRRLVSPLLSIPGGHRKPLRNRVAGLVAGGLALLAVVRRVTRDRRLANLVDDVDRGGCLLCAAAAEGIDDLAVVLTAADAGLAERVPAERAGMLVLDGDPTEDISAVARVVLAAEDGVVVRADRAVPELRATA